MNTPNSKDKTNKKGLTEMEIMEGYQYICGDQTNSLNSAQDTLPRHQFKKASILKNLNSVYGVSVSG